MPIKLSDLRRQRRRLVLDVHLADDTAEDGIVTVPVIVVYNPGLITEQMFDDVSEAAEAEDETQLNHFLATLCVSWDVTDEDGKPIPFRDVKGKHPAPELSLVPIPFKGAILGAIMRDVQEGNLLTAGTSNGGSQPKAR